jgi:predicted O-methyltransferase YrrM
MQRKNFANAVAPLLDILFLPFALPAAVLLWMIRRLGLDRLPMCRAMLLRIGLLPVRHHYYEPFAAPADLKIALNEPRRLPGIDWNESGQLAFLDTLTYADELADLRAPRTDPMDFRLDNASFESGDAEFLYQLIRQKKPRRVFEIGSGYSTLLVRAAIRRNSQEAEGYVCKHVCIEPYEMRWLEQAGPLVLRQRVEEVDKRLFQELDQNDLLFIDSSHVIRPQGDVLSEYLEIVPSLRPGVMVHVHDIFSPRDYPADWVKDKLWLWNEQYLLEALLTDNRNWEVVAALNMLKHDHFEALHRVCPYLTADREPGSIYLQRKPDGGSPRSAL